MVVAVALIVGLYCAGLLVFTLAWNQNRGVGFRDTNDRKLSVIIPVRNEEDNIHNLLTDIRDQQYPKEKFEVIVVDDESEDNTTREVEKFISETSGVNLRLVRQKNGRTYPTPKKKAITRGVMEAAGEIIVTTDGDCRVDPEWLSAISQSFDSPGVNFISGPVVFDRSSNFFEKLQNLEFASLIGVGASSMRLGFPNICNGANLAFIKEDFLKLNGYRGNGHIASGDDEFLLQKFAGTGTKGIRFLKDARAIVKTAPKRNLHELYHQRKRWTSKLRHHKEWHIKLLSGGVFLVNLVLAAAVVAAFTGHFAWRWLAIIALMKFLFEALFLSQVLKFFQRPMHWAGLITLEIIHPIYIILFGIFSNFGTFSWKGRTYHE